MREIFGSLALGLAMAVVVIFLLLTAYFQSVRLALTAVAALPAVLAGVVLALLVTGTTVNLQSFMGAIMAVGVSIANAILLVTLAARRLETLLAYSRIWAPFDGVVIRRGVDTGHYVSEVGKVTDGQAVTVLEDGK